MSNYYVLLLVRFCFGAGEAGAYPNASAVIARGSRCERRGLGHRVDDQPGRRRLSPLLVVPIQMRYGWRAPFFVFGVLGVVWSVAWYAWFATRHTRRPVSPKRNCARSVPRPALQHHGMPWARALRIPALWRIAAIAACYVYALGFFQGWLQTYLVKGRGFTEAALVLSSLTYVVGATANGLGGWRAIGWSSAMVCNGRRWLGVAGLSVAALFLAAAILRQRQHGAGIPVGAYGGILFSSRRLCALCLDVGRNNAGAVFGFMNTAANASSALPRWSLATWSAISAATTRRSFPMVALLRWERCCGGKWTRHANCSQTSLSTIANGRRSIPSRSRSSWPPLGHNRENSCLTAREERRLSRRVRRFNLRSARRIRSHLLAYGLMFPLFQMPPHHDQSTRK